MRKKALSFVLTFLFILNLTSAVFAAESAVISGDQDSYALNFAEDQTFDVTFNIELSTPVMTVDFVVNYDPSVIQMVEIDGTPTDGYLSYPVEGGGSFRVITENLINTQIHRASGVGSKTTAENGSVRLAAIPTINGTSLSVTNETNAKLMTLRFKTVGTGSTTINLADAYDPNGTPKLSYDVVNADYDSIKVNPVSVTVNGSGSSSATTTTTEAATETTTAAKNNSSDNNKSESTTAKTTETTTEVTTNASAAEVATEESTVSTPVEYTFNDISRYPWAVNAIEALASKGIINGLGNGKFEPAQNVKRADFLIMLLKALEISGTAQSNFNDVRSDKYYANTVGLAKDLGIANGTSDGNFNPEQFISRQDMMVLAERALASKKALAEADETMLDKFDDKSEISSYAVSSVAKMVNANIVSGTGSSVEPKANTTRAQAAVIINNIYNYLNG